jgi:formate dehydrogenase beta subunit
MNPVESRTLFGVWSGVRYGGEALQVLPAETKSILLELCEMSRAVPDDPVHCVAGWKGFFMLGPGGDPVDMAREYACKIQEISCGKCLPCRTGTRIIADLLTRICNGYGCEEDLETIDRMIGVVRAGSMCEIGHQSIVTVQELMGEFRDVFTRAVAQPVRRPRGHYDFKVTAPCIEACPVHLDIPKYIELIRSGRYAQALDVIREHNPLPAVCGRVCVRFCEQACRRSMLDDPVDIKHLKQFVSDAELESALPPDRGACASTSRVHRVVIVGTGPAGVMAAYVLLRRGYDVTMLEAMEEPGGMAALGIPDYRLPRKILRQEIGIIESMGAKIRYATALGRDVSLQELHQSFDALFLAIGTQKGRPMGISGEEDQCPGYMLGVDFLRRINLGRPVRRGRKALVVGGGNVAMDCSRSALRLGFDEVHLVYRRDRAAMPADKVEVHEAEEEGVRFHFQVNPTRMIRDAQGVTGVECVRMRPGQPDDQGRSRPVPIDGSEYIIDCDMVIPAIGQRMDISWMEKSLPLETTPWKTLAVDPLTMETSVPGIFAGGDCTSGPATLVEALAAGERAARSMDHFLRNVPPVLEKDERLSCFYNLLARLDQDVVDRPARGFDRMKMRERSVRERVRDFDQVEESISPVDALDEADRCLRCYRIVMIGRGASHGE